MVPNTEEQLIPVELSISKMAVYSQHNSDIHSNCVNNWTKAQAFTLCVRLSIFLACHY